MIKKIVLSFVAVLVVLVGAGVAFESFMAPPPGVTFTSTASPQPPTAAPDAKIIAGPVTAISATSITVKKQDGSKVTLGITSATPVTQAATAGAGVKESISDIKVGAMVLVTPGTTDATVAQSVVLLPKSLTQ